MAKRKGNYRTVWNPEVLEEYLKRIAIDGMSARAVGKMKDMPSYESFHYLKSRDAEVDRRYHEAMESRATAIDDEIDDVIKAVATGEMDYNAGRLAVDTMKWRMTKLYPRFYGDNQRVEVEHKASFVDELKRVAARVEQAKLEGDVVIEHDDEGQNAHTATPAPARTANRSQLGAD
tara:strand:- start:1091 stop:1618 length:528 start_codon:yes stop_codon:yes gene_type:complete